jgi:hypothetical protein
MSRIFNPSQRMYVQLVERRPICRRCPIAFKKISTAGTKDSVTYRRQSNNLGVSKKLPVRESSATVWLFEAHCLFLNRTKSAVSVLKKVAARLVITRKYSPNVMQLIILPGGWSPPSQERRYYYVQKRGI